MKTFLGVLIAVIGMFLVWTWYTGKADSVWKSLMGSSGPISQNSTNQNQQTNTTIPQSTSNVVNAPAILQNMVAGLQITQPSLQSFVPPSLVSGPGPTPVATPLNAAG